jgi:hypothetical protein
MKMNSLAKLVAVGILVLTSAIADAKAFRLSRTAKNQKDFKIQAMDSWKRGKPFAMVVCPIYHKNKTVRIKPVSQLAVVSA